MEIRREGLQWAMTELEGIKSEAPGCSVTPEKEDRHISNVTLSQTAHRVPKTLMGDLRAVCSRLWTAHDWPGNLTGIQNPESLQFCRCSFLSHFLQLLHFPSRSWVSPATLLSLANSCTVQNHWGGRGGPCLFSQYFMGVQIL